MADPYLTDVTEGYKVWAHLAAWVFGGISVLHLMQVPFFCSCFFRDGYIIHELQSKTIWIVVFVNFMLVTIAVTEATSVCCGDYEFTMHYEMTMTTERLQQYTVEYGRLMFILMPVVSTATTCLQDCCVKSSRPEEYENVCGKDASINFEGEGGQMDDYVCQDIEVADVVTIVQEVNDDLKDADDYQVALQ